MPGGKKDDEKECDRVQIPSHISVLIYELLELRQANVELARKNRELLEENLRLRTELLNLKEGEL